MRDAAEIERLVANFASEPNSGVIVAPNPVTIGNHDLIVRLAAAQRLPGIYPFDFYATTGGLMSYGPDQIDMFRRAASYITKFSRAAARLFFPYKCRPSLS